MSRRRQVHIVAIIQARMGSTRLAGKVLMDIAGRPLLWYLINRLRFSKLINKIVIATTLDKKDDAIEEFCKKYDIAFYRGNEEDVLDRYYQTAKAYNADCVVRITSDCPLLDPEVVDKVITAYLKNRKLFDGASNTIKRTFPRGLDTEVISFATLEKVWEQAKDPYQREHVTVFIYEHLDLFKIYSVEQHQDLSYLRWTVDEKKDLEFVKEVYRRLYSEDEVFLQKDILRLLKNESWLQDINKDIKQKSIFQ